MRSNSEKQEDIRNALDSLERKYKTMLETLQTHAVEARKNDEVIINEFKEILDKHKIPYNV